MGQSFGSTQLSTFNEKKGVTIGQVIVQTNEYKLTEVSVVLSNTIHPLFWNKAILELRPTDTDRSLNIKRFFRREGEQEIYGAHQFKNQFDVKILKNNITPLEKQETQFALIDVPFSIELDEQSINQSYIESQRSKTHYFPYSEEERDQEINCYRDEYIKSYMNAFEGLQQKPGSNEKVSIGILDMRPNNPIIGIDNYQMTLDILQAFINIKPCLEKLIFISEDEQQAYIMGLALQQKQKQLQHLSPLILENIEMEIPLGQEHSLSDSQVASQKALPRPDGVSYEQGHIQCVTFSYFKDFSKRVPQAVFQSIVPKLQSSDICLCGRKTTMRGVGQFCCYCRQTRSTFMTCEERACGRQYCAGCLPPNKTYKVCHKGHKIQHIKQFDNTMTCEFCYLKVFRIGLLGCNECKFYICGYCFFSQYADQIYSKLKMQYLIIKKRKPNLRNEVLYELLMEYLVDFDMDAVWKL